MRNGLVRREMVLLAMLVMSVCGAAWGGEAGTTVTLEVPRETKKTGKQKKLAGDQAEDRFIDAKAVDQAKLGKDAKVITNIGAQVFLLPNSEKQVLAKCNLTPEVDLHKARIRGTYSTPGRGGDGDGKPPVWEATGTDGCVFEGIFYEKNTATTVFENPAEKNTKIENKKYAPAANKTFEDMRKKVVVPFGDGTAYGYYTSLSQGEYKGTHIDNEQTKVEYGKPCPSCDQKWLCVYRVAPKIAVKKTDWEFEDNSATFITLAFWVENKESATNPEATIGWKIHYAEVKTHEDKHKADYQAYLTSVKAAVEKYNSKVLIAKACGKSKAMAFKRAREIMGGELTELLKEFNNALVTAKNNDDKAAQTLDLADYGAIEKLVPAAIPLAIPKLVIKRKIDFGDSRWEVEAIAMYAPSKDNPGYKYWPDKLETKWTLAKNETWLAIDEKGKVTGKPEAPNWKTQYKTDKSFSFTVELKQYYPGYEVKSLEAEDEYKISVKSWIPVIVKNIPNTPLKKGDKFSFSIKEGTGIPHASAKIIWSKSKKMKAKITDGAKSPIYKVKVTSRKSTYTKSILGKHFFTAKLTQKYKKDRKTGTFKAKGTVHDYFHMNSIWTRRINPKHT